MDGEGLGAGLLAAFAAMPVPRSRHGRQRSLPAILALAAAAMLSRARSLYPIAQWGRVQLPEVLAALCDAAITLLRGAYCVGPAGPTSQLPCATTLGAQAPRSPRLA